MLILAVTATWWLVVGRSVALPTLVSSTSSSSVALVASDNDFRGRSIDNKTGSSISKDNSVAAFVRSTNGAVVNNGSSYNSGTTRIDNSSTTTPSSRSNTRPYKSAEAVKNAIPVTSSSTASGYTSSSSSTSGHTSTAAPDYALTFAEMLAAITAEFVFTVAGDHVLFPMDADPAEDRRLHTTAVVVAELLQRLHITPQVYQLLNASTCAVASDMQRARRLGAANPVGRVLRLTAEAAAQDPRLRDEYAAARQRLANQIYSRAAQHGRFASTAAQTLYDVTAEQQAYAERLMADVRVKKLIVCVTFFRASQFEEPSAPEWVRRQASLARATFALAQQPEWRDEVQRVYDEAVAQNLENFDAMAGDDELIFQTLREKFERNAPLRAELEKLGGQFAQTKT